MQEQLELTDIAEFEGCGKQVRRCDMCGAGGPLKAHHYKTGAGKIDVMMVCGDCKALLKKRKEK